MLRQPFEGFEEALSFADAARSRDRGAVIVENVASQLVKPVRVAHAPLELGTEFVFVDAPARLGRGQETVLGDQPLLVVRQYAIRRLLVLF